MIKLISLFLISSFLCTSALEVTEFELLDGSKVSSINHVDGDNSSHCEDDCDEENCPADGDCCQKLCKCSSAFIVTTKNILSYIRVLSISKLEWGGFNNYLSPPLDPGLKPPLLS